jgi:hypothetical protein
MEEGKINYGFPPVLTYEFHVPFIVKKKKSI